MSFSKSCYARQLRQLPVFSEAAKKLKECLSISAVRISRTYTSLKAVFCTGGILSDVIGRRIGMRGRLWWLFFVQMSGAVLCVILGIGPVERSLANTIGVIIVFSFCIEVSQLRPCLSMFKIICHL